MSDMAVCAWQQTVWQWTRKQHSARGIKYNITISPSSAHISHALITVTTAGLIQQKENVLIAQGAFLLAVGQGGAKASLIEDYFAAPGHCFFFCSVCVLTLLFFLFCSSVVRLIQFNKTPKLVPGVNSLPSHLPSTQSVKLRGGSPRQQLVCV